MRYCWNNEEPDQRDILAGFGIARGAWRQEAVVSERSALSVVAVVHAQSSNIQCIRYYLTRYRFVGQTRGGCSTQPGAVAPGDADPDRIGIVSGKFLVVGPMGRREGKGVALAANLGETQTEAPASDRAVRSG